MGQPKAVSGWILASLLLSACSGASAPRSAASDGSAAAESFGRPTVFARGEGERRMMRGTRPLFITADSVTVGSRTLMAGYEDVPPGDSVRVHKHLGEDEVIFIHGGTVELTLGEDIRHAETGATVFIPRGTWIGMRAVGPDTARFFFVFNTPAFEKCLRMLSAPPGEAFRPPPRDVVARVGHECHMVLKSS